MSSSETPSASSSNEELTSDTEPTEIRHTRSASMIPETPNDIHNIDVDTQSETTYSDGL